MPILGSIRCHPGHVDINVAAGSTATIQESILKEDPEGGHGVGHRARKKHKAQPTRGHGLEHGREADMDGGIARKSVGSPMRPARYISDPSTLTSQNSKYIATSLSSDQPSGKFSYLLPPDHHNHLT